MTKAIFKLDPSQKKYPNLPDNYEELTPKELLQLVVNESKKVGDIARHNIKLLKAMQARKKIIKQQSPHL